MSLYLNDKWIWDFWFVQEGACTHIFFLQAPKDLRNENLRHQHASIGHARSRDLVNWEVLADALEPSDNDQVWDNLATWTGSIIEHNHEWYLFYTGISANEDGKVERIGLARSKDLIHWEKYAKNPIIRIDPQEYETLDESLWYEETWRDPWVIDWHGSFHALITARCKQGEKNSRGVIGHAISEDLVNWEVLKPIQTTQEFAYLEVPQIVEIGGRWYLFFSVEKERYSSQRSRRFEAKAQTGTHYMVSDHPLGPYRFLEDEFLLGDEIGRYYSGKVLKDQNENWYLFACRQYSRDGVFLGEISDPMLLHVQADGKLEIEIEHEFGGITS